MRAKVIVRYDFCKVDSINSNKRLYAYINIHRVYRHLHTYVGPLWTYINTTNGPIYITFQWDNVLGQTISCMEHIISVSYTHLTLPTKRIV